MCGFISSRGYRAAKTRPTCARASRDEVLMDEVTWIHVRALASARLVAVLRGIAVPSSGYRAPCPKNLLIPVASSACRLA